MKRCAQLHGLSTDHHHALVLSRQLAARAAASLDPSVVAELRRRFDAELSPHFATEEEVLLPALARAGERGLVERTLADHAALRDHLAAAELGDVERVHAFATLLEAHVRFEERELFVACERLLSPAVLDQVARKTR